MENPNLIETTAQITSAFLSQNTIEADGVPTLIGSIYSSLSALGQPEPQKAPEPAVSIRQSVKPDHVTCLCCGKKMKMLKRHLRTEHNLSPAEYREMFNLADDHPLVAPEYAEVRADLAKKIGLGRKPKTAK